MKPQAATIGDRRVGRPPGPTAQGAASRDQIIDAAAGVFARMGYDRARMADIVRASGLTKGSVYFHFDGKESLAVAVLTARQQAWLAQVAETLGKAEPGLPRLRTLLPTMLALHADDPDAWVVARLSQNLAELPATADLAAETTQRWVDLVAELIRSAVEESIEDPELLATVVVGAFDGLKLTTEVLSRHDPTAARRELARGGAVLERMLLSQLSVRPESPRA